MSEQALVDQQKNEVAPSNENGAIISMIERAAKDPNVDIEKMERLFTLHEKMLSRNAESEFNAALARLQSVLPEIAENGEIRHNNKLISTYKKWEDVNRVIKPYLAAEGFALSFRVDTADKVKVAAVLSHAGGHSERTSITLPADTSGSKNPVQAVASSVSYGKRYTAESLLNITSPGQDDDAQSAVQPATDHSPERDKLVKRLGDAADKGNDAFMNEWQKLSREDRNLVGRDEYNGLKHHAGTV